MGRLRGDATMLPFRDESVHAIVTSPPYNVGVEYPDYTDRLHWDKYIEMAFSACEEMWRVLVPGGRAWINVQASVPYSSDTPKGQDAMRQDLVAIWRAGLGKAGFAYRDYIVWIQDSHDGACAWGSWLSPSAPNLRGGHEIILLVYKHHWKRFPSWRNKSKGIMGNGQQPRHELGGDWTELVRNVWTLRPANAKADPYPARFPIELPARCIRLSTWPTEVVLDPFCGSGTTMAAAEQLGRVGIGVDLWADEAL